MRFGLKATLFKFTRGLSHLIIGSQVQKQKQYWHKLQLFCVNSTICRMLFLVFVFLVLFLFEGLCMCKASGALTQNLHLAIKTQNYLNKKKNHYSLTKLATYFKVEHILYIYTHKKRCHNFKNVIK